MKITLEMACVGNHEGILEKGGPCKSQNFFSHLAPCLSKRVSPSKIHCSSVGTLVWIKVVFIVSCSLRLPHHTVI